MEGIERPKEPAKKQRPVGKNYDLASDIMPGDEKVEATKMHHNRFQAPKEIK